MRLEGRPVQGREAEGWLVDRSGSTEETVSAAWTLATGGDAGITRRPLTPGSLSNLPEVAPMPTPTGDPAVDAARGAIYETVVASTATPLADALEVQSRHSAKFFGHGACRRGVVGAAWAKTSNV